MYKDSIVKLEKEYNLLVIKNTKLQLELQNEKDENENVWLENNKQKEIIKEQLNDITELRRCLHEKEGYTHLETTVNQLINMLVSKKNDQLTQNQRQQLKSIFGNHSILYKLRQRIQAIELHYAKIS